MLQGGQYCNKVFGFTSAGAVALGHNLARISLSVFDAASTISFRSLSYLLDPTISVDDAASPSQ